MFKNNTTMNKLFLFFCFSICTLAIAQQSSVYKLQSPDNELEIRVNVSDSVTWSVKKRNQQIIVPSSILMTLEGDEMLGINPEVVNVKKEEFSSIIKAINYKKKDVEDHYNELIGRAHV